MIAPTGEGRVLAIDFGTKRIGLALSDELGWSARPLSVWQRRTLEEDLAHLRAVVAEHEVKTIVVGLPYHQDGRAGASAARATAFIDALREAVPHLPLHTLDETLTTFEAEDRMRSAGLSPAEAKRQVDAYAALVILEEFVRARGGWAEPVDSEPPPSARRSRRGGRG